MSVDERMIFDISKLEEVRGGKGRQGKSGEGKQQRSLQAATTL